ncbi:MAG: hypothetical protein QOE96_3810 [Blastocatellia bacterium]|jgi:hypothetical protein|nr:hypothetical protein [Blastocatellia bacterium]
MSGSQIPKRRARLLIFVAISIVWFSLVAGYLLMSMYHFAELSERSAGLVALPNSKSLERPRAKSENGGPADSARARVIQGSVVRREQIALVDDRIIPKNANTAVNSNTAVSVERYPTLDCPAEVSVTHEFAVQFSLTEDLITPEVAIETGEVKNSQRLSLTLPERDYWTLDVVISASAFTFRDGVNRSTLKLPKNGDSTPSIFFLRPKAILEPAQKATINITLWHEGSYLAKIGRQITILNSDSALTKRATSGTSGSIAKVEREPLSFDFSRLRPDMTIYVLGDDDLILSSRWQPPFEARFQLDSDYSDWIYLQYSKFSELGGERAELSPESSGSSSTLSYAERANNLMRGAGRTLYAKYAPRVFKDAFCQLARNHGADFKTIEIYSRKPDFPWELLRPICTEANGTVKEHEFLGTEFAVGRWHLSAVEENSELPPQLLKISKLILIAPEYKETRALPSQQHEIEVLRNFTGYERLPGQLSSMRTLFQELPEGIVYFTGHSVVASTTKNIDEYSIELEDGPLDLMTWRGMVNRQNKNHPLFFFNACNSGQTQRVSNFIDGWGPAVLEGGASGYIGTLWPVSDKGAAEFGVSFSRTLAERLKQGPVPIAEVLLETRRKFLTNGDPTFLAYIYYGDAHLNLRTSER